MVKQNKLNLTEKVKILFSNSDLANILIYFGVFSADYF